MANHILLLMLDIMQISVISCYIPYIIFFVVVYSVSCILYSRSNMYQMSNLYNTAVYLLVIILPVSIICCCIGLCRRYLCNNANKRQTQMQHIITGQVPSNSTTPRYVQEDPIPAYLQGPPDYTEVSMPPPSYEEVMKHTSSYDTKGTSDSTSYET
ncbi:hypothetical protein LOTGIDRAFT_152930 [Lottia gigantea]|uniref:Uncharacterized protein n=1 Tax=Lottia gigantea TaxID=225164 RepID=V4AVI0_LOTGI|nr:hypothetical protein LOTGIDRAFT_152930 [Lottia gigantea]ESO97826.1 hypothetical protein LOTGIDRAFT_152930 [Lottia gigantea]